eukprot:CAMPEP_0183524750 /NCGR_PEP_ID=MMETSP0371-20130417/20126_1 /TAXON_ID=268820 /ORGANISM="Peridinium aciculiferum, Strain PAER-2" /LENGTH=178 /DNA_ID=CAMNT_0025723891 /DNA_START=50 /DNA_END=582 /DNA_ORIENTATION=-
MTSCFYRAIRPPWLCQARACAIRSLSGAAPGSSAGLLARVVGFEAGNPSRPIVLLDSTGERLTATLPTSLCKTGASAALAFRQQVLVERQSEEEAMSDDGSLLRVISVSSRTDPAAMPVTVPLNNRPLSPRYAAITRGPNNVGLYAWAARRERARLGAVKGQRDTGVADSRLGVGSVG